MLARSIHPYPATTRLRSSLDPGAWRQVGGATDKLDCGNPSHLQNLTRFALIATLRPAAGNVFGRIIAAKRTNIAPTGSNGWIISVGSATGGVAVRWRRATTNLEYSGAQVGFLPLGEWSRLVVILDQTASQIVRAFCDPGITGAWREAAFSTQTAGSGAYSSDAALNCTVLSQITGTTQSFGGDCVHVGLYPYVGQAPEQLMRLAENPFPYERQALLCLYPGEQGGGFAPRDVSNYRVAITATNGQAVSGPLLCWRRAYHMLEDDVKATAALTQITLSGGITPTGGLARLVTKPLAGALSPVGDVVRRVTKLLAGGITPAGAVTTLKVAVLNLAGSLAPVGALVRRATKVLAGGLSPVGALARTVTKLLSGALTPSGGVSTIKVAILTLAGGVAPSGGLVRRATKALGGGVAPVGALVRTVTRVLSGTLTPAGSVARRATKVLAGGLAPSGGLLTTIIVGGGVVMRLAAGITIIPLYAAGRRVIARLRGDADIGPEA